MDKINNNTPSGYSLNEVLAAVKEEKRRAKEIEEKESRAAEEEKIRREEEERTKAEIEEQIRRENEAIMRAEEEKRRKLEEEKRIREEEERRYRLEVQARERAKYLAEVRAQAREKAEAEVRKREEMRRKAYQKIEQEAKIKAKEIAKARAELEAQIREEEEERARIEAAQKILKEEEARILKEEEEKRLAEEAYFRESLRKELSSEVAMTDSEADAYRAKIRREIRASLGLEDTEDDYDTGSEYVEPEKSYLLSGNDEVDKLRAEISNAVRRDMANIERNLYADSSDAIKGSIASEKPTTEVSAPPDDLYRYASESPRTKQKASEESTGENVSEVSDIHKARLAKDEEIANAKKQEDGEDTEYSGGFAINLDSLAESVHAAENNKEQTVQKHHADGSRPLTEDKEAVSEDDNKKAAFKFPFFYKKNDVRAVNSPPKVNEIDIDSIDFSAYTDTPAEKESEQEDDEGSHTEIKTDASNTVSDEVYMMPEDDKADESEEEQGFKSDDADDVEIVSDGFVIDYSQTEEKILDDIDNPDDFIIADPLPDSNDDFEDKQDETSVDGIEDELKTEEFTEEFEPEAKENADEIIADSDLLNNDSAKSDLDSIILEVGGADRDGMEENADQPEFDNRNVFSRKLDKIFNPDGGYDDLFDDNQSDADGGSDIDDGLESDAEPEPPETEDVNDIVIPAEDISDGVKAFDNLSDTLSGISGLEEENILLPEIDIDEKKPSGVRSLFSQLGKLAQADDEEDYPSFVGNASSNQTPNSFFDADSDSFLPYGLDEYNDRSDDEEVGKQLGKISGSGLMNTVILAILAVVSILLNILPVFVKNLPAIISPTAGPTAFSLINVFLVAAAAFAARDEIEECVNAVITRKTSLQLPVVIGTLLCLIYDIVIIGVPSTLKSGVSAMATFPILGMLLCVLSRYFEIDRIKNNFEFMTLKGGNNSAFEIDRSNPVASSVNGYFRPQKPINLGSNKSGTVSNFFASSFGDRRTDKLVSSLSLVSYAGSFLIFLITLMCGHGFATAMAAGIAVLFLSSPIFVSMGIGALQLLTSGDLMKRGGSITGVNAVERYAGVNSVVMGADELFDGGSVTMSGIKFFKQSRTDVIIELAAAATIAAKSPLGTMLGNMFDEEKKNNLPKVESVHYHDDRGLVAVISGVQILVGNSGLLEEYGIESPSKSIETKIEEEGKASVYVVIDGELSAMFAVTYSVNPVLAGRLRRAGDEGVNLVVYTTDPGVTSRFLERHIGFPDGSVYILPTKLMGEYFAATAEQPKGSTAVIHNGSFKGYINTVVGALRLRAGFKLMRMIQTVVTAAVIVLAAVLIIALGPTVLGFLKLIIAFVAILFAFGVAMFRKC